MFGIFYFPFLVTYFFNRFVGGGRKMLCFGWLCPLYAGGLSLPVGGFLSGFSMVDSTNFLLKPKFFKNFLSSVFYLRTEITNFVPKKKTL